MQIVDWLLILTRYTPQQIPINGCFKRILVFQTQQILRSKKTMEKNRRFHIEHS